jgi:hypothetical protein
MPNGIKNVQVPRLGGMKQVTQQVLIVAIRSLQNHQHYFKELSIPHNLLNPPKS